MNTGFMNQFRSVTDPDTPERHIGMVFEEISGGATPTRVLCCGHSLGGALATLASAWASYEYPDADVRCVTLGSPRVGNPAFVDACRCTASRQLHPLSLSFFLRPLGMIVVRFLCHSFIMYSQHHSRTRSPPTAVLSVPFHVAHD